MVLKGKPRKLIKGVNDLATTHPEIAKQADGWDPQTLTAGSGKKVSWICSKGHNHEGIIVNKTKRGDSCPVCSGKKVLAGFNDFAFLYPALAKEAHGWDPAKLTTGSGKKVSWKCKKGHTWDAPISTRTKGHGCPYCSGFFAIPGETDLTSTHPELAREAHGWDPKQVKAGTNGKRNWKCNFGHIWSAEIYSRVKGDGCSICSGHQVLKGFNDLKTKYPKIAREMVDGDPSTVTFGSDKSFSWCCSKGHEYQSTVSRRTYGSSCPFCSGNKVLKGFNDLLTVNPTLATEADGWDPTKYSSGSSAKKMNWRCKTGHNWSAAIASRSGSGVGCPKCSGRDVITGENDLQTLFPKVAQEADGWDPKLIMAGSGKKMNWRCQYGHSWTAQVGSRSFYGNDCPICSNQKTLSGINDMATTHPKMSAEADGWDPRLINAGDNRKYQWICSLGHTWKTSPHKRKTEETNCPSCSNHQVWAGFNDLATTHPLLALEADGWDPQTLTAGSGKKVFWKCSEGHRWKTVPASRTGGNQTGCPSCAISGYSPNEDGYLYFITHPDWEMLQIGITNFPENRLKDHKRLGWEVLEIRGPMDGLLAQGWETSILQMLKKRGAKLGPTNVAGKFSGFSEAWMQSSLPVKSIKELMRMVEEMEAE